MFDIWKSFCYIEVFIVQKSRAYGYGCYSYILMPSVKRWRRATDEWNGYMECSYRNTMHDSKRVCLKEVIIILE